MNKPPTVHRRFLFALGALIFFTAAARAQQAIHTDAAVQPSAGHLLFRQLFTFGSLGRDPTGFGHQVREYIATTDLTYGATSHLALTARIPVMWQSVDSSVIDHSGHGGGGFPFPFPFPDPGSTTAHPLGSDFGLDDITVGFKWRIYEHDFGPIETMRVALLAAVETPTGEDAYSSDSWDPIIGGVISYIEGRNGVNFSAQWKFNTGRHPINLHPGMGEDNALFYNASYLFRILPGAYSSTSRDATYLVLEGNGIYETNGDHELLLAPGIMWEGKSTAIEASVQFPIYQEMENRPKTNLTITVGIRFLF